MKFCALPGTSSGARPIASMAPASSVTRVAGALPARRAACRCGTSAASAPATCRRAVSVAATRPSGDATFSVSASRCASRPPTASCCAGVDQARRSASGVTRQRAASCTSTQSCGPAPRCAQRAAARCARWRRGSRRRRAAGARPAPESRGSAARPRGRPATTTSAMPAKRSAQRAKAVERVRHHRPAGDALVLLGPGAARAAARAGAGNQDEEAGGGAWDGRGSRRKVGRHSRIALAHPSPPGAGCSAFLQAPSWTSPSSRRRQALHAAPPAAVRRRPAAGPAGRAREGRPAAPRPSSPPTPTTRSA